MRDCSHSLSVSTELFPTLAEGTRGARPLNEPNSSSELTSFGSQQHLAVSQMENSDCLEDTRAANKLFATRPTGSKPDKYKQKDRNRFNFLFFRIQHKTLTDR